MDNRTIEFCGEVLRYFAAESHYKKFGDKDSHLKILQLSTSLPGTAKKLSYDIQSRPDSKKENTATLADLLPKNDLIELLFLDKGVRKLSRSATKLLARCDQLGIHHRILLELERDGYIEHVPDMADLVHYQTTTKHRYK
jgi:hypothetical protein